MLKNEIIKEKDLIALRPCVGIPAKDYNKIVGKKLKIDKKSFTALSFDDFKKWLLNFSKIFLSWNNQIYIKIQKN